MIELDDVRKEYPVGSQPVLALAGVSLTVGKGTFVSVMGPSGSGKSTLLHLLAGVDRPTSGSIVVDGSEISRLDDDQLTAFRRDRVGLVFQAFNLLPMLSAWENVAVPRLVAGRRLRSCRKEAVAQLDRVGLAERADHRPGQLSGGQMQRVAIARALMNDPTVILADEPTGNLDRAAGDEVLRRLASCARDEGRTVVMVTHDERAAAFGDRILRLADGVVDTSVVSPNGRPRRATPLRPT